MRLDPQLQRVLHKLAEKPVLLPEDDDPEDVCPGISRAAELGLAVIRTDGGFGAYIVLDLTARGREIMGASTLFDRLRELAGQVLFGQRRQS